MSSLPRAKKPFAPTAAQLEEIERKKAERASKKAAAKATGLTEALPADFLKRDFVSATGQDGRQVTILTWNILAQGLVRRTLFPGSDCLKWSDRRNLIHQVPFYNPDVVALQELDRIEDHADTLRQAGYDWIYEIGYDAKVHGLLIGWKKSKYTLVAQELARFDNLTCKETNKTGLSRRTRNIGLVAALKSIDSDHGLVIATHHAFWHARHVYERTRQLGLWLERIRQFQQSLSSDTHAWPLFLAGDFNTQPVEMTYQLLANAGHVHVNNPAMEAMKQLWEDSRVVHSTVDAAIEKDEGEEDAAEGEGEDEGDPDRVLHNCRPSTEADGLLTWEQTCQLYERACTSCPSVTSAYDAWYTRLVKGEEDNVFGIRKHELLPESKGVTLLGDHEPMYTNFTPLWRCTLDYIFALSTKQVDVKVTGLLKMPRPDQLEPGLPRKGVSASDHLALMAQFQLGPPTS